MPKDTRQYDESDRTRVAEKLGGTAGIDATGNHIEIVEDGPDWALALWIEGGGGIPPTLGEVITTPERSDMFYAALLAVIEALIARGDRSGTANVRDKRVALMLQRDLGKLITVTPMGRNVKTGEPGYWQIDVVPSEVVDRLKELA